MRIGLLFLVLAVGLGALAMLEGGLALLALWPAIALGVVSAGYLGLGARIFGKRADGTHPPWARVLLAPYLGLAWIIWQGLRRSSVRPYSLVAPRLYLGRRLYHHELPPDVALVVDLTAELTETSAVREGRDYRALPALDAHVPDAAQWDALVAEVAASDAIIFVHCAAGHGRSAAFLAAVLIHRGLARDVDEAERMIQRARPSIRIRSAQRALVARMVRGS